MNVRIMLSLLALSLVSATACPAEAKGSSVSGYTKKDGTYVAPHRKTAPNRTKIDNYSSKGNTNPYTGKDGKVDPNKLRTTPSSKR